MQSETRNCKNCKTDFSIEPEDFSFYEKIQVPPPTFCPTCRLMRRLAWRSEWSLYKRQCDMCHKNIIAMFDKDVAFPVYCRECWFSDDWDPTNYAREYDPSKNFFQQFYELLQTVPQPAVQVHDSVNCEYTNQNSRCKNCYLLTSGARNEDSMYSYRIMDSRDVVDGIYLERCESCYEARESQRVTQSVYVENCSDSMGLYFCYDMRGCTDCFMSSNQRNKSYMFRNEALTKEAYEGKMRELALDTRTYFDACVQEFDELKRSSIHAYMEKTNSVDVTGHNITNAKNCESCFHISNMEDSKYCYLLTETKDSYDVNHGCCTMERMYEVCTGGVNTADVKFSADAWPTTVHVEYSQSCRSNTQYIFGCISLRNKQYCILNKQYSKEEYFALRDKIMSDMQEKLYVDAQGIEYRYGEFFPVELSLFRYNESAAYDYFPLTKIDAEKRGYPWKDLNKKQHAPTMTADQVPDSIKDIDESILQEIIPCLHDQSCAHRCTGAFRIVADELQFYKSKNIPLPRLCPHCRHGERLESRLPMKLYKRTTQDGVEVMTSYAPDRPEKIYSEKGYQDLIL